MTDNAESNSSGYTALVGAVLELLSQPGTWLTAAERVAIAALSRDPDAAVDLKPSIAEAAIRIAYEPSTISADWVAGMETSGLGGITIVEILGVVSRQLAIDRFMFGVGAEQQLLPPPNPGGPTKVLVDGSILDNGFLPTVGPASPCTAFSAVPADQAALEQLTAGLYLPLPDFGTLEYTRDGLSRAQMELVATRASFLNNSRYCLSRHGQLLRDSAGLESLNLNLLGVKDIVQDSGVPSGHALIALTDAVVLHDDDELEIARTEVSEHLGVPGTVRAIAIAANFMMLNIVMETLGTPPEEFDSSLAKDLGLSHAESN